MLVALLLARQTRLASFGSSGSFWDLFKLCEKFYSLLELMSDQNACGSTKFLFSSIKI